MKAITIKDGRGKDSSTLPLIYVAFSAVMFRFLVPASDAYPSMTGTDFGLALAAVGGIWLWREKQTRG